MSNHMNNHHNDFIPWFGVLDNALGLTPVDNPFEDFSEDFDEDEYNADLAELTEMEQFSDDIQNNIKQLRYGSFDNPKMKPSVKAFSGVNTYSEALPVVTL